MKRERVLFTICWCSRLAVFAKTCNFIDRFWCCDILFVYHTNIIEGSKEPVKGKERVNYLDKIAAEIQRIADPESVPPDEDISLYRLYALLLLTKGTDVTLDDVHNAWVVWASDHEPDSRYLIPFKELSLSVQHKDQTYVDAIHEVADHMRLGE